ncbi:metal-dependent hydrolase [Streptomyces sp. VRA16 Mangrove soil]|uniref:metal-dependent hydrolase n=1 Tax=Streptomyces sp. VRA16 Mangrove soil TaxID=2817434 RepID=UPI0035ABF38D
MSTDDAPDPAKGEHHAITPRRVSFDWEATPLHWIPDEPTATHVINVLHLLLPAGERWFVKVFKEGLSLVENTFLVTRRNDDPTSGLQGPPIAQIPSSIRPGTPNMAPTYGAPAPPVRWFRASSSSLALFTRPGPRTRGLGGAAFLARHDPQLAGRPRYSLAEHNKAVRKGLLPSWRDLDAAIPRYLRRSYHPSQEGSLRRAVEYLAVSPAARAAAGAIGRSAIA